MRYRVTPAENHWSRKRSPCQTWCPLQAPGLQEQNSPCEQLVSFSAEALMMKKQTYRRAGRCYLGTGKEFPTFRVRENLEHLSATVLNIPHRRHTGDAKPHWPAYQKKTYNSTRNPHGKVSLFVFCRQGSWTCQARWLSNHIYHSSVPELVLES